MNRLQKAITIFGIAATVNAWGMIPSIGEKGTLFSIATASTGQNGVDKVQMPISSLLSTLYPLPCCQEGVSILPDLISQSAAADWLTQANPTPGMDRPLTDELDINLLAKTVAHFIQAERYQTESEMHFSFKTGGFAGQFSVLIKTIAQSPQQFRSEIYRSDLGAVSQPNYILVSNGQQVWIYSPD